MPNPPDPPTPPADPAALPLGEVLNLLRGLPAAHDRLNEVAVAAIETARDRGETWATLGEALGKSRQAVQQQYRRAGGTRTWPPGPTPHTPARSQS